MLVLMTFWSLFMVVTRTTKNNESNGYSILFSITKTLHIEF